MTIEYDGTDWHGWQIQADRPTIQKAVEDALETVLRTRPALVGSGRTDAGVHARGQVAHFTTDVDFEPFRLQGSLNGILPATIAVRDLDVAPDSFHARYDARLRRYAYYVATEPRALDRAWRVPVRPTPDFERMNAAALALLGTHDFDAFCRAASETENRVCTVERAAWMAEARAGDWRFEIAADRFLHGMVRAIVGTLFEIGRGQRPASDIPGILESRDRRLAGPAADARGLVLESVSYEDFKAT